MSQSGSGCNHLGCPHSLYQNKGYCIFHLPKLTDEQKKELTPEKAAEYAKFEQEFRRKFFALLNKIDSNPEEKEFNFRGFQFVDIDLSNEILKEKISGWQGFQKPVTFNGSAFQYANFNEVTFKKAHFIYSTFKKASFIKSIFQYSNFFDATFQDVDFSESFLQDTSFNGVTLYNVNFNWATFQETFFKKAILKKASFFETTFQDVNFFKTTFPETDFEWSLLGKAEFIQSTFTGIAMFSNSTVQKKVTFRGSNKNRVFLGECEFREIDIKPEASVIFEKVDLDQASFLGTNIENFVFRDVQWYRKKRRKIALWDEFENKNVDLSKLADNYHQLVLNYEKKREFDTALEFHIGEMEVRRRLQGTSKITWFKKVQEWVNAYALYRLVSYYGTSYWRALSVLGVMLLLFSGVFLFFGFQPASISNANISEVVNYDWFSPNPASLKKLLLDYWSALEFSFSILTLQRNPYFEAVGDLSKTLVGLAGIFFYSQVALLLLAIRRRFKQ
jgi:uncharacterized protein YjbI with pentapeptide repeats